MLTGLLSKLKPFLDAPNDLDRLINEVAGLKIVLSDLRGCAQEVLRLVASSAERIRILESLVNEGLAVLLELERLIEYDFKKLSNQDLAGKNKVYRIKWVMKTGEVEKLKERLSGIKLSISVQIGSMSLFVITQNLDFEFILISPIKALYCTKPPYPR